MVMGCPKCDNMMVYEPLKERYYCMSCNKTFSILYMEEMQKIRNVPEKVIFT